MHLLSMGKDFRLVVIFLVIGVMIPWLFLILSVGFGKGEKREKYGSQYTSSGNKGLPLDGYHTPLKSLLVTSDTGATSTSQIRILSDGLYAKSNSVLEVDGSHLLGSYLSPQLVIFYASWCGHCVHFAPKFKSIAQKYKKSSRVTFYAVDCAKYRSTCNRESVARYPTIKAFGLEKKVSKSKGLQGIGPPSADDKNKRGFEVGIKESSIVAFLTKFGINPGVQDGLPVYSDKQSYNAHISTLSMSAEASPSIRLEEGLMSLKYLLSHLDKDVDNLQDSKYVASLISFLRMVAAFLPQGDYGNIIAALESLILKVESSSTKSIQVTINDHFPQLVWQKRGVHGRYWSICGGSNKSLSQNQDGSSELSSGAYTCGLWMLFHFVSAAGVNREPGRSLRFSFVGALDVMNTIKSFVRDLFQCSECQRHFLVSYESCEYSRCNISDQRDFKALALWLWKLHNGISARVWTDKEWPPEEKCPTCLLAGDSLHEYIRKTYWDQKKWAPKVK